MHFVVRTPAEHPQTITLYWYHFNAECAITMCVLVFVFLTVSNGASNYKRCATKPGASQQ